MSFGWLHGPYFEHLMKGYRRNEEGSASSLEMVAFLMNAVQLVLLMRCAGAECCVAKPPIMFVLSIHVYRTI